MGLSLRRTSFATIDGWAADGMAGAFAAFRRSARHALNVKPYRTGSLGLRHDDFAPAYRASLTAREGGTGSQEARDFFESWFRPWAIEPGAGAKGLVTAFYEPVVRVRAKRDDLYRHPFLRPPPSLVRVDHPDHPPPGIPDGFAFCITEGGVARACPERREIETGAFDGTGLEIAYACDKADVFFAHVQGAARLDFGDGEIKRITYAAKSGHAFTGIGRLLVERGEIDRGAISMQAIRQWLASHPDKADELMWKNRSFIFFRAAAVDDPALGPVAAAKVPLTPGRSLAVDRLIHTFGTPFFITAPALNDFDRAQPFARLMIAQDTGSAITGAARGDLFTGSGDGAGELAGAINCEASFILLAPRGRDLAESVANRAHHHG